jgi:two-component system, chemotaxis family, sensor kinase CheA
MARLNLRSRNQWLPIAATLVFASALTALLAYGMQRATQLRSASSALQVASELSSEPQLLRSELTLIQRGLETQTYVGDSIKTVGTLSSRATESYGQLKKDMAAAGLTDNPDMAVRLAAAQNNWQSYDEPLRALDKAQHQELYTDSASGSELNGAGRELKRTVDQLLIAQAKSSQQLRSSLVDLAAALRNAVIRDGASLRTLLLGGTGLALMLLALMLYFAVRARESSAAALLAERQVSDILATVREGLFLIDRDGVISDAHSASLSDLLHVTAPAGQRFEELLEPLVDDKTLQAATRFLALLWKERVHEDLIESVNPLGQIEVRIIRPMGGHETRHLSFSFRRVRGVDNTAGFLLGAVSDVTERVLLARELDQVRSDSESQAAVMLQLAKSDPVQLQMFLSSTDASLRKANALLTVPGSDQAKLRSKLDGVYREVHSIKGDAAALGIGTCVQRLHAIEDLLGALRTQPSLSGDVFVPVVIRLDELMTHLAGLSQLMERFAGLRANSGTQMVTLDGEPQRNSAVVGVAMPVAPAPAVALESLFRSLAAEVGSSAGREVQLQFEGLDIVPPPLATRIKNIVVQMIRNAIVHGIETPEERTSAGKPAIGMIRIAFRLNSGDQYTLTVEDDGQGLAYERIIDKALRLGLVEPAQAATLDKAAIFRLIFQPGFSTSEIVTEHAGRGIGLDVVNAMVRECGGRIGISTAPGQFSRFKVLLPRQVPTLEPSSSAA